MYNIVFILHLNVLHKRFIKCEECDFYAFKYYGITVNENTTLWCLPEVKIFTGHLTLKDKLLKPTIQNNNNNNKINVAKMLKCSIKTVQ